MIELKGIDVTFNAGTPLETRALRGVDLTVPAGEFLTVIGSNGAGKSTALNVLAGQVPVAAGAVRLHDQEVTDWPIYRRAPLISRVFQDPKMGTCEDLTIIENFRSGPRSHPAQGVSIRHRQEHARPGCRATASAWLRS